MVYKRNISLHWFLLSEMKLYIVLICLLYRENIFFEKLFPTILKFGIIT